MVNRKKLVWAFSASILLFAIVGLFSFAMVRLAEWSHFYFMVVWASILGIGLLSLAITFFYSLFSSKDESSE